MPRAGAHCISLAHLLPFLSTLLLFAWSLHPLDLVVHDGAWKPPWTEIYDETRPQLRILRCFSKYYYIPNARDENEKNAVHVPSPLRNPYIFARFLGGVQDLPSNGLPPLATSRYIPCLHTLVKRRKG